MGPLETYRHFLELLQRHRAIVWERCWRYSDGDFDRCRDLVQEVTLHLCLHRDDLRPGVSENEEREWLMLLTRRTLHNLHRKKGGNPRRLATALEELSGDDPAHGFATGGGTYYELDTMRMEAFPASNQYQFDFRSDGNTANPRLFVVRGDTAFTAFFRNADGIEVVDGTAPLFTLTPNPTKGKVTITVTQPEPQLILTLRDADGHEVLRKELSTFNSQLSTTLDLRHLPAGAYFVTLSTPTASSTQRLVVK